MDVSALTTTEAIRAAIGIDITECQDSEFSDLGISNELEVDLYSWFPQWQSLRDDPNSGDDLNITFQQAALKTYAKYQCAVILYASANMRFLQRKSDGEVESQRYNQNNIEDQRMELKRLRDSARTKILELDTPFTPEGAVESYTLFSRAIPTRDVITE